MVFSLLLLMVVLWINNTVEDNDWDGVKIGQGTDGVTISIHLLIPNGQNPGPNANEEAGTIGIVAI